MHKGIGGHDPNSRDKDELGHVPNFLPAYSLCNSDSSSISVNSYSYNKVERFRVLVVSSLFYLEDVASKKPKPIKTEPVARLKLAILAD